MKGTRMRVVTGLIAHETSTFTTVETTRMNYQERYGNLRGNDILQAFRGTNKPTGGFIEGAEVHGFELIPTIVAEPHPSAPTPRALFDEIIQEMLNGFSDALSLIHI